MMDVIIQGTKMNPVEAGALLTVCGVAIVFLVLVVLIVAIIIFGKVVGAATGKVAKEKPAKVVPVAPKAAPVAAPVVNAQDDGELIAVIAAAVDAMYAGSGKKAIIRNIRPASTGGRSAWATAGLMQNVRSF